MVTAVVVKECRETKCKAVSDSDQTTDICHEIQKTVHSMWDADQITTALKYNASDDLLGAILNVSWRLGLARLNSENFFLFVLKKSN